MKLVFFEFHKVWLRKSFLLGLGVLLLVNLFLIWTQSHPSPAKAYFAMERDLAGLTMKEKQVFLNEKYIAISALSLIDWIYREEIEGDKQFARSLFQQNKEIVQRYVDIYAEGNFLRYTDDLYRESNFIKEILDEFSIVNEYAAFLYDIQDEAQSISKMSIFNNLENDKYEYNNIISVAAKYKNLENVTISYTPEKGVITAIESIYTDIIAFFAMFLLAYSIISYEKEGSLLKLVQSTPSGRLVTSIAKILVFGVSLLFVLVFLYGLNIVYCSLVFGLGDLMRSVQSLPSMMNSVLKINVAQYLMFFLFAKWMAFFVIGMLVIIFCLVSKRLISGFVWTSMVLGISFFVRATVPATSRINVLKYANLASIVNTNELFGRFRNLYFFANPISLHLIELFFGIVAFLFFIIVFCILFSKGIYAKSTNIVSAFTEFQFRKKFKINIKHVELYKLFLLNRVIIIVGLLVAFVIYQNSVNHLNINTAEMYYRNYMLALSGPYTKEKFNWLAEQQKKFEPVFKLNRELQLGNISDFEYDELMGYHTGLNNELQIYEKKVLKNILYNVENPKAHLIYDSGYPILFGYDGNQDKNDTLWAGLFISLSFVGIFAMEKSTGMIKIINATPLGKQYTAKIKLGICIFVSIVYMLAISFPNYWLVGNSFGFDGLWAPAMSLQEYHFLSPIIPVVGIIIFSVVFKIMAGAIMATIVMFFSEKMGRTLPALFSSCAVLCLPILLSINGIPYLEWFSLYPLFHFSAMLTSIPQVVALFLYVVIFWILGYLCILYVYDNFGKT